jgi:hypothetical protein
VNDGFVLEDARHETIQIELQSLLLPEQMVAWRALELAGLRLCVATLNREKVEWHLTRTDRHA